MKKYLKIVISSTLLCFILGGGWFWYASKKQSLQEDASSASKDMEGDVSTEEAPYFVTAVDSDINHWQTKETEYFTIKFPKEWYWLEVSPEKIGGGTANVISNNPQFPLAEYSDIGMFTSYDYPLLLKNDSEIVITTNNLGFITSNFGTPREFMDGEIARIKKDLYPEIKCIYTSKTINIPLTAFCTFENSSGQKISTYYVAMTQRVFAFTARATSTNNIDTKSILEKIAQSLQWKKDF
jgi:hypothetical protein